MNPFTSKINLCTLILACFCVILGCGSDNSGGISSSRKDQKPQAKQKGVIELMVNTSPGQRGTTKADIQRKGENLGNAGSSAISDQEVEAAIRAAKQVDPRTIEVIPPDKPGERGITQQELDAAIKAQKPIDREVFEVTPPQEDGTRGITQQELDAAINAQKPVDREVFEVTPPQEDGTRGITQQELATATKASEPLNQQNIEVLPPSEPGGRGVTLEELNTNLADQKK